MNITPIPIFCFLFIYFFSGVLYLIGVIVFVIKFKEYYMDPVGYDFSLSYAFFLSCVALVLEIIGGVFMIIDRKKSATSPSG